MPRLLTSTAILLLVLVAAAGPCLADVVQERAELHSAYGAKLDALVRQCEAEKLPNAAAAISTWLPERRPDQLLLFLPPNSLDATANDFRQQQPAASWREKWQSLRNEQADALLKLARRAVEEHRSSLAYELIVEALRENPEHERARAMLGYQRFQDAWHTPFEIRQLRGGKVWHEQFGWLPKAHVARYEQGERFSSGRWMTAEEEAQLRRDIKRGWKVETEHYAITTNHSLEEGVALARRLEAFYDVWQQVFATYLWNDQELLKRLDGKAPRLPAKQHQVVYFRTRDEYNAALRSAQPRIEMTLGIYFDTNRTAYFFAGDEQQPGTLYHEAAHQLFQETRNAPPHAGRQANFWIVEGIACYFESFAEHDGYYTLGGDEAGRMPAARHRLLIDNFYIPLSELAGLGRDDLQRHPDLPMVYSQSAGLADFLMQAYDGQYRDALARYLQLVYSGKATPSTLSELTGRNFETLDREYRAFMSAGQPAAQAAR